jgi:ELWxxDGT repeat protein
MNPFVLSSRSSPWQRLYLPCVPAVVALAGLPAQTPYTLLQDIVPGFAGSSPRSFVELHGRYFFSAGNLYRTDGTPAGTVLAVDSTVIGTEIHAEDMVAARDMLWFASSVFNSTVGAEPWVSDGTNAGSRMVVDLKPGSASSLPRRFLDLGDRCAFLADTDLHAGPSLVISDGTAAGTSIVAAAADPSPGNYGFAVLGRKVFFTGRDAASGNELWVHDLTSNTTSLLADLWPGPTSSDPWIAGTAFGRVWFHAQTVAGVRIWTSDGTGANTLPITGTPLKFSMTLPAWAARPLAATLTKVFIHSMAPNPGLFVWDPVAATVTALPVIPAEVLALERLCAVVSTAGALWVADGTAAGTVRLSPTGTLVMAMSMRRVGARHAFFAAANSSTLQRDLWRTDGTVAGTQVHVTINTARNGISDAHLFLAWVNGGVCWNANHELYGSEPTWSRFARGVSAPIGTSCGGLATRLVASDAVPGANLAPRGSGAHLGAVCGVVLMPPAAAPIPLGNGCHLYGDPALLIVLGALAINSSEWTLDLLLPADPGLIGARAVIQAVYAGGATPLGLATTNGVLCRVGI